MFVSLDWVECSVDSSLMLTVLLYFRCRWVLCQLIHYFQWILVDVWSTDVAVLHSSYVVEFSVGGSNISSDLAAVWCRRYACIFHAEIHSRILIKCVADFLFQVDVLAADLCIADDSADPLSALSSLSSTPLWVVLSSLLNWFFYYTFYLHCISSSEVWLRLKKLFTIYVYVFLQLGRQPQSKCNCSQLTRQLVFGVNLHTSLYIQTPHALINT